MRHKGTLWKLKGDTSTDNVKEKRYFFFCLFERFMINEVILDLVPFFFHTVTDPVVRILKLWLNNGGSTEWSNVSRTPRVSLQRLDRVCPLSGAGTRSKTPSSHLPVSSRPTAHTRSDCVRYASRPKHHDRVYSQIGPTTPVTGTVCVVVTALDSTVSFSF